MAFRFVFEVKVRSGEDDAFIENWREGSKPIQEYPGALGTSLHKKRGEEHVYIAVAKWQSREKRQAAMKDIAKGLSKRAKRVKKWGDNEDFGEVTIIGEYNEVDRALPPYDKK